MKKFIALLVGFIFIFSVAYADDLSSYIERWNKAANVYGAPLLSLDTFEKDTDGSFVCKSDKWIVIVLFDDDIITQAGIYASDTDTLLPLCATIGVAVVKEKTADMLMQYDSNILNMFLRVNAGKSARYSAFDIYQYTLKKRNEAYAFVMVKQ